MRFVTMQQLVWNRYCVRKGTDDKMKYFAHAQFPVPHARTKFGSGSRASADACVIEIHFLRVAHYRVRLLGCGIVGRKEARSSFLKKRSKRLLFLRRSQDPGHGRDLAAALKIKFFASRRAGAAFFFRKEELPSLYEWKACTSS
jgi:hypothetical protein